MGSNLRASQELIDYFKKEQETILKDKINIPQEEPKQEILEEAAKQYAENEIKNRGTDNDKLICSIDFIAGASWQAKRMYSEEEVSVFVNAMISEIEIRKQNIMSNSDKMEVHLLEGGCMAFESSQDVIIECFKQFKDGL